MTYQNSLPDLLTFKEVAMVLRISKATLRRYIKQGKIKSINLSDRTPRILKRDLVDWLKSQEDSRRDV